MKLVQKRAPNAVFSRPAKEIPVSDAKSGGNSPTRPGTNDAVTVDSGNSNSSVTRHKRSVRRQTKRPRDPKSGIRAENLPENPPPRDDSTDVSLNRRTYVSGEVNSASANSSNDKSVLSENTSTKRRRRRRNRKLKQASVETGVVEQQPVDGVERPDESTSSRNHNKVRNRNRRKGRRQGGEAGKQSAQAQHNQNDQQKNAQKSNKPNSGAPGVPAKKPRQYPDLYAALDLGTNNCRLLVAVPQQPGRFRVVDAFSKIVRLGEGLAATGALSSDAMDRAVGALKSCADKLSNKNIKGVRLIATEACRRASNGVGFLERVELEAGLKLEIVDRESEARLAVAGCASLVDRNAKGVVLFDIGGGSSELALLDLRKRKKYDLSRAMVSWTSLPMGVVTLSEKHGGGKHVTRQIFDGMVAEVAEHLERFEGRDALKEAASQGEIHLLGTSGTVTTLAGIHLKLPRYDRRQVDGIWMASNDVDAMIEALVDMSFEQRVSNPCIGHDRADLVLAGCAILVAIQRLWPCPRLRVADRGLREGLLTEMMNADNAWVRRPKYFRHKRN